MSRASRICSKPGCPTLTTDGRCTEHQRAADRARGTARERGYNTREHRTFRTAVLDRDPICTLCRLAASTVADHFPTSRRDLLTLGLDPNDPDRGRGLCKRCHDRQTAVHQPGGWGNRHTQ